MKLELVFGPMTFFLGGQRNWLTHGWFPVGPCAGE